MALPLFVANSIVPIERWAEWCAESFNQDLIDPTSGGQPADV